MCSLATLNGNELAIVLSGDIQVRTSQKEYGQKSGRKLHNERNKLIKAAKEFREQYDNGTLTEAPLEGARPTDSSTGEGAWPGAPAAQYPAPATAQKGIIRHIVEFCTSENSKIGDERYTKEGCSVMRCSLKDDVTTNAGLKRAIEGVT